jgi:hypothetical protein
MPQYFSLTAEPVRASATGAQDLRLSKEVGEFHELEIHVRMLNYEGGGAGATILIETGMNQESSDGWITLDTFTPGTSVTTVRHTVTNPLRYIRWNVSALGGGVSPAVTFHIQCIGRTF